MSLRKIAALVLAFMVLSAPLLACALPGQQMSDAEMECCQHMSEMCGSSQMADSHSCCTKAPEATNTVLQFTSKFKLDVPDAVQPIAGFTLVELPMTFLAVVALTLDDASSPPGYNSVLRI